jgi:phage regulator Rha-like protein
MMNELITTTPLTMSSIELAELMGKRHDHVLRDVDRMLDGLGIARPKFGGGYLAQDGAARRCYNLPRRETLILVSGYSVDLRARIIDRWDELERAARQPAVGHFVTFAELDALLEIRLDRAVKAALASQNIMLRRGKTAGQLWRELGLPPIKSIAVWFGNILTKLNCQIEGGGRGELGVSTARLFDPDKVRTWIDNGGRSVIDVKIRDRQGQRELRLIGGSAPWPRV